MHKSNDFENIQTIQAQTFQKTKHLSHDLASDQVISKQSHEFSKDKLDEFHTITENHMSDHKSGEYKEQEIDDDYGVIDESQNFEKERQIFVEKSVEMTDQHVPKASERIEQNELFRVENVRDSVKIRPKKDVEEARTRRRKKESAVSQGLSMEDAVRRLQANVRRKQRSKSIQAKEFRLKYGMHNIVVKDTLGRPGKFLLNFNLFFSKISCPK